MVVPRLGSLYTPTLPPGLMANGRSDQLPVILVDATALMFRAFYAMPPLTSRNTGLEVGAVVGFCNMLVKLLLPYPSLAPPLLPSQMDQPPEQSPPPVILIFDTAAPTFRDELFAEYKANRGPPPPSLGPQFDVAFDACDAFGWSRLAVPGYEADDIIATCAAQVPPSRPVTVVGSDKDLMQLVNDQVSMYDPVKKMRISPQEVEEKFGVPPSQLIGT